MAKVTAITSGLHRETLKRTHTAAVAALDIIVLTGRVLVALNDSLANANNIYVHEAQIEAPKAAVAITAGQTAYWDNAAGAFTTVVGTNTKCGMFTESAVAGDALAQVSLTNEVNL